MAIRMVERAPRHRSTHGLLGTFFISAAIVLAAALVRRSPAAAVPAPVPAVVAAFDSINLPVPIDIVPAGTRLGAARFKSVSYPRDQLPEGAVTDIGTVAEAVALAPLPAHVPVFRQNLSFGPTGNPVTERIPPGMRAMTMRVDAAAAVEGWAGSGTTVDVLLIEKDRTTVVAEHVTVLSAERSVSPVDRVGAPAVPSTVTLLVSQEQCLAINTAIPRGKIAFALRSDRDDERWGQTSYTAARLTGATVVPGSDAPIAGYAAVHVGGRKRAFALTNGRWIATEVMPHGFGLAAQTTEAAHESGLSPAAGG